MSIRRHFMLSRVAAWLVAAVDLRVSFRDAAGLVALVTSACSNPTAPTPQPSPPGPPAALSTPTPAPSPSGTASSGANHAPTFTDVERYGLECSPADRRPCSLTVLAIASDPDGDPLTFSATAPCLAGDSTRGSDGQWFTTRGCSIPSPGDYTSVLTVRDGRGGEASTSVVLKGLLNGVRVSMQLYRPKAAGKPFAVLGTAYDGSRLLCSRIVRRYAVTGECRGSVTLDLCLNGGFDMDIFPSGRPGVCEVTVTVANEAGVEGTGSMSFDPLAVGS